MFFWKKQKKEFLKGIPSYYSYPLTKDILERRVCKQCGLYFKSTKSNQQHSAVYRMNESSTFDKIVPKKVRPQRVAARRQQELLCVMAFQELKWNAVDDVEFEGNVEDIDELAAKSGTSILTNTDQI